MKKVTIIIFFICLNINLKAHNPQNFTYPNIPDSITIPKERANYLVKHYWEKFDFTKKLTDDNKKYTEQFFVDFISLFPHSNNESIKIGINNSMSLSSTNTDIYTFFSNLFEKYLFDKNSPQANEFYFMFF
jgi:hypothetical protein